MYNKSIQVIKTNNGWMVVFPEKEFQPMDMFDKMKDVVKEMKEEMEGDPLLRKLQEIEKETAQEKDPLIDERVWVFATQPELIEFLAKKLN